MGLGIQRAGKPPLQGFGGRGDSTPGLRSGTKAPQLQPGLQLLRPLQSYTEVILSPIGNEHEAEVQKLRYRAGKPAEPAGCQKNLVRCDRQLLAALRRWTSSRSKGCWRVATRSWNTLKRPSPGKESRLFFTTICQRSGDASLQGILRSPNLRSTRFDSFDVSLQRRGGRIQRRCLLEECQQRHIPFDRQIQFLASVHYDGLSFFQ